MCRPHPQPANYRSCHLPTKTIKHIQEVYISFYTILLYYRTHTSACKYTCLTCSVQTDPCTRDTHHSPGGKHHSAGDAPLPGGCTPPRGTHHAPGDAPLPGGRTTPRGTHYSSGDTPFPKTHPSPGHTPLPGGRSPSRGTHHSLGDEPLPRGRTTP